MAKLTYLQIANRILKRITQPEVATLQGASGTVKIVSEFINEAQNELWTETTNWYSLFTERNFNTFTWTGSTLTFAASSPATITDSGAGFGSFKSGQTIRISGSTFNDGIWVISSTVAPTSSVLTLQASDMLVAEAPGHAIQIYPITYPVAADFGRAYHIVDLSNDRVLTEDVGRAMTEDDPQMDNYNEPTHFAMQGDFYRFYYIPNGVFTMVDRYWKIPPPLSADADVYALPIFCENFIIQWALRGTLEYMNKFDAADRITSKIYSADGVLAKAKMANKAIIDRIVRFQPTDGGRPIAPPRFSSHYGARYY